MAGAPALSAGAHHAVSGGCLWRSGVNQPNGKIRKMVFQPRWTRYTRDAVRCADAPPWKVAACAQSTSSAFRAAVRMLGGDGMVVWPQRALNQQNAQDQMLRGGWRECGLTARQHNTADQGPIRRRHRPAPSPSPVSATSAETMNRPSAASSNGQKMCRGCRYGISSCSTMPFIDIWLDDARQVLPVVIAQPTAHQEHGAAEIRVDIVKKTFKYCIISGLSADVDTAASG